MLLVLVALTLGNLALASVGYLEVLMLLGLIGPVSIFYTTIRDATGGVSATVAPAPEDVDRAWTATRGLSAPAGRRRRA